VIAFDVIIPIVLAAAVVLAARYFFAAVRALTWCTSGEPDGLVPRGFVTFRSFVTRMSELQAIVSRLALITRLNLPLEAALEAATKNESRRRARAFRTMGQKIRNGAPVWNALETAVPNCPGQLVASLRLAEGMGQLPEALAEQERAIEAMLEVRTRTTAHMQHAAAYAAIVLVIIGAVVAWNATVMARAFEEIFRDFDVALPPITVAYVTAIRWFVPTGLYLLLGVVALILIFGLERLLEGNRGGPASRMIAAVRWALPFTRSVDYGLGMARAIRAMSLSIRGGSEQPFAKRTSTVVCASNHVRYRLEGFAQEVASGTIPSAAARDARLGDVFVCALRMVERGEDPECVLGHAADYYEAIAHRWWRAMAALSVPLVTLALGALVAFVALALFTPLVTLIHSVADSI